jgi:hypothetical protein
MCTACMIDCNIRNVYSSDSNGNIVMEKVININDCHPTGTTAKLLDIMPIQTVAFFMKS